MKYIGLLASSICVVVVLLINSYYNIINLDIQRISSYVIEGNMILEDFITKEDYANAESTVYDLLRTCEGQDAVVIYISGIKAVKRLPANWNVSVGQLDMNRFYEMFGEKNVKVVEKPIEIAGKRD